MPKIGLVKGFVHRIKLTTDVTVTCPIYPVAYKVRHLVEEELDHIIENQIIRTSDSPYNAPCFTISKTNNSIRNVNNYI